MSTESDQTPTSGRRSAAAAPLFGLILVTSLLAQQLVLSHESQVLGWVLFAAVALLAAMIAPRAAAGGIVAAAPAASARFDTKRLLWLGVTVAAVVIVTGLAESARLPFLGLALWLFAFLSASLVVGGWHVTPGVMRPPAFTAREVACLVAIVAVAALARFSWINTLPGYYFNDEPRVGSYLLSRMRGDEIDFFRMGWNTWSGLGLWVQGALVPVLGLSVKTLRLSSAVMGTLSVLTTYLLARELLGKRAALLAAILLAVGRASIDFSRLGVLHAQVLFIATFSFWCWWRAVNTGSALAYLWAGIGLGWGLYSYNAGYLLPVIWGGWLLLCALAKPRTILTHWRGVALTLGGFLLSTFVYLSYVTDHFTFQRLWYEWTYMARNRQVLSHILDVWQADGFSAALTPLWRQVSLTWLGFTVIPDNSYGVGYRAGGMLDQVSAPLFVLGLAIAAFGHNGRRLFLLAWWLATAISGGVLTDNPPATWRLVGIVPLLAIFAALPLDAAIELGKRHGIWRAVTVAAVCALLTAAAWDNWRSYFIDFGSSDAMLDLPSALSHDIEELSPDTQVILLGADGSLNLHAEVFEVNFRERKLIDATEVWSHLPIRMPTPEPVLLVLAPLQTTLVDQVRALYPGARFRDRIRTADGQLMYRRIDLTPQQVAAALGLAWMGGAGVHAPNDPFAPLPIELAGESTHWRGHVFWPSDRPLAVELRSDGPTLVRLGGSELRSNGSAPATASIVMARGWQPISLQEEQASAGARPSLTLTIDGAARTLDASDLRPDLRGHGLHARYERGGQMLLHSIEPQLNLCTMEPLFAPETLAINLPFIGHWQGVLQVAESGVHDFEVIATAPYSIRLDGTLLCNEDKLAIVGPTSCLIARDLSAGRHDLSVWWDGSNPEMIGHNLLQLKWRPPGKETLTIIAPENFG